MLVEPHHDGSALHVSTGAPRIGDPVTLRVRVPDGIGVDRLHLRVVHDAEPLFFPMRREGARDGESWWSGEFVVHNPRTSYRFLTGGASGYGWLTATGWHRGRDVLDVGDFQLSTLAAVPAWVPGSVVLQIFPDRFARSADSATRVLPDWAEHSEWDEPVGRRRGAHGNQVYGGDLEGIVEHLDHIASLGTTVLYLTPVFPAGSIHRYDAATFDDVDALLGGRDALARLVAAAHARGIRVIGDLTTNHTGHRHEWFRRAQSDPMSREAGFYLFTEHPDGYVGWLDHASLPKLDWRNEDLRDEVVRGPDSVVGRWLRPPVDLDGWRIDVANMTGRYQGTDQAHEIAREIRATVDEVRPDAWLVGEHAHDAGPDLAGDGWHGTMNYSGFLRPVWTWLSHHRPGALTGDTFLGIPTGSGVPVLSGRAVVAAMRESWATMPWPSLLASMNALDTHDTARFITVTGGDVARYGVGLVLLFTMPGVPMVFAGAETGIGAPDGELSRIPIPWEQPERWDADVLAMHRQLAAIRGSSPALHEGGLRWLAIEDDAITFERTSADGTERIIVHASRGPHDPVHIPAGRFSQAEVLWGDPPTEVAGQWMLPADGPAGHIWRVRQSRQPRVLTGGAAP